MRSRTSSWLVVLLVSTLVGMLFVPAAAAQDPPGPAPALPEPADPVSMWNRIAGQVALDHCLTPGNDPLHEVRMYAIVHIAIHDALNAIDRESKPYAFSARRGLRSASPEAAVAAAARTTLLALIAELPEPFAEPACATEGAVAGADLVRAEFDEATAAVTAAVPRTQGVRLGDAAAYTIMARRAGDGSDTPLFVTEEREDLRPGVYRFTPFCPPPASPTCPETHGFDFLPDWGDVRPFAVRHSSQHRAPGPYALTSPEYAADFNEVKLLGQDTSAVRTADQTQMATFWYENSPLAWNRIARTVAAQTPGLTMWDNARLFGLLNIAMADGYITNFETKRHFYTWRPVTAIRAADTDDNPATTADPTWAPLTDTPPVPSYASGHAVEGAAAAEVMASFFGTDRRTFVTCSLTTVAEATCTNLPGELYRTFTSFSQAAEENALSRLYAGIHFRNDVEDGLEQGRRVADHVLHNVMRPRR